MNQFKTERKGGSEATLFQYVVKNCLPSGDGRTCLSFVQGLIHMYGNILPQAIETLFNTSSVHAQKGIKLSNFGMSAICITWKESQEPGDLLLL